MVDSDFLSDQRLELGFRFSGMRSSLQVECGLPVLLVTRSRPEQREMEAAASNRICGWRHRPR